MFFTIVIFILVLSVLVLVHEWGHFYAARRFGVKSEEFGLGFPPRAFGTYKNTNNKWKMVWGRKQVDDASDTIYSVNWFPLGGFVKIKGEDGADKEDDNSFSSRPIWQRVIILMAGVFMNVFLAYILFSIGFAIGMPQPVNRESNLEIVGDTYLQIAEVFPNSPAERAGLKMSDIVDSIDGKKINSQNEMSEYNNQAFGKDIDYKINRGNEMLNLVIKSETVNIEGHELKGIGVSVVEMGMVKYPIYLAFWEGLKYTLFILLAIIMAFYGMLRDLIFGGGEAVQVAGPVGIASLTGQAARLGFSHLLQFMSILSINLAILNAFPFPALDGGRVVFLIIEKIKGSPVKKEFEAIVNNLGFIALMALVVLVTYKDIASLWQ